jgi:hypothetical protein
MTSRSANASEVRASTINIDFYCISTWPMPSAHRMVGIVRNSFRWKLKLQQYIMNKLYGTNGIETLFSVRPFVYG